MSPPSRLPDRAAAADTTFFITIIGKGIGGLFELLAGIALLFLSIDTLQHLLQPLAKIGLDSVVHISPGAKLFGVIYFSLRGFIRVILAISLLREQLWAYPVAILLLATAILYQAWLLVHSFSIGLLALTVVDLFIVVLTVYEYRKLRGGGHLERPHL